MTRLHLSTPATPEGDLISRAALLAWCDDRQFDVVNCLDLRAHEEGAAVIWLENFRAAIRAIPAPQPQGEDGRAHRNLALLDAVSIVADHRNGFPPGPVFKLLNTILGEIDGLRYSPATPEGDLISRAAVETAVAPALNALRNVTASGGGHLWAEISDDVRATLASLSASQAQGEGYNLIDAAKRIAEELRKPDSWPAIEAVTNGAQAADVVGEEAAWAFARAFVLTLIDRTDPQLEALWADDGAATPAQSEPVGGYMGAMAVLHQRMRELAQKPVTPAPVSAGVDLYGILYPIIAMMEVFDGEPEDREAVRQSVQLIGDALLELDKLRDRTPPPASAASAGEGGAL